MANGITPTKASAIMEALLIRGDLADLSPEARAKYYTRVCESLGLNPLTRPFEYITLNGRLTLYARKDATEQLRKLHGVSIVDLTTSERDGVYVVTVRARDASGRTDMATGAVATGGLKGEALANALMRAETKAKRRVTLSICGLGMLDETETEDIPVGAGKGTTLPKKDARDIYAKLQDQLNECADRHQLLSWHQQAQQRIAVLPDDWQHILRLRYEERLAEFPETTNGAAAKFKSAVEKIERARSIDELADVWATDIDPHIDVFFPPDVEELKRVYRERERQLSE